MSDRILTTHVGSLIRPQDLQPFLQAVERGQVYDRQAFEAVLRERVKELVQRQADAGIDIVNDGEFGKISWITYFYERVNGIETRIVPYDGDAILDTIPPTVDRERFGIETLYAEVWRFAPFWAEDYASSGEGISWACTGPIVYDPQLLEMHLAIMKEALEGVDVSDAFVTALSPASLYWITNEYYESEEAFVFAIAEALAEEYKRIVAHGFVLQVDDAVLWHKYATIMMAGGSVRDYERWAKPRVEALNHALAGLPQDRVRYHICSSSGHGPHVVDPRLEDVLDLVLEVNAGAYLVEQANARHEHEWTVWKDGRLPEDKVLIPGVVTHHTEMVEHPELVAQRLVRIADVLGPERVIGGTDCGFAQAASTVRVPQWTQWAKLEALTEGARLASKEISDRKSAA